MPLPKFMKNFLGLDDDRDEDEFDAKRGAAAAKSAAVSKDRLRAIRPEPPQPIPFLPSGGVAGVGDLVALNYKETQGFAHGPFGLVLPEGGTWGYVIFTATKHTLRTDKERSSSSIRMSTYTGIGKGGAALDAPPDSSGFAWRIR